MRTKAASSATSDMHEPRRVYLDYHATTPCDPAVVEAMIPFLNSEFGNASSTHSWGERAARAISAARIQLSIALNCEPEEIVFTSGATESNNLALLGLAAHAQATGRRKIIASAVEHKSILAPCAQLQQLGFEFEPCPVGADGRVDLGELAAAVDHNTLIVAVQLANNEIGTVQPVAEAAQIAHRAGALVHCDAAQAFGKIPVDARDLQIDFMSLSAHKCYGPKGVGAFVACGPAVQRIAQPIMHGGNQERGLRPGTLNVPGAVGFATAATIACDRLRDEGAHLARLRGEFERALRAAIPTVQFNGNRTARLPGASSVTFPGIDAEALVANLPDLALSTGSACNGGALEPSHVLRAIGLSRPQAYSTIRLAFGRFSSFPDSAYAVHRISQAVNAIQRISNVGASGSTQFA